MSTINYIYFLYSVGSGFPLRAAPRERGRMLGFSYVKSLAASLGVGLLLCALAPSPAVAARNGSPKPASAPEPPPPTVSLGRTKIQGTWTPSGSAIFRGIPF